MNIMCILFLQDELWEKVASALNCAGSGPQKLPKEWAKTWRDWKSNLLKKVATHKSYAGGTGGGPPKTLTTTPAEDNLLAFLTPKASGMPDIPEGGAIGDSFVNDSLQIRPLTAKEILTSQNLQDPSIRQTTSKDLLASQSLKTWKSPKKTSCSQRLQDATTS
ncbi:hypothetical protein RF55_14883 [Lasius niger]|uniref:Regulatory protein zeste n=1 Tax=Lasius niger TaxID=67767 RepID=A0A0J7K7N8_LASNI|nr:hypothetical protein RF55_14883 [Lasius niger]